MKPEDRQLTEAELEEFSERYAKPMAEAWVAGKAPAWMYQPPFFCGLELTNWKTKEIMQCEDESSVSMHMPLFEELASKATVLIELGVGLGHGSARAFTRGMKRNPAEDKIYISVDFDRNNPEPDFAPDVECWHMVYGRTEDLATVEEVYRILDLTGAGCPDIVYIDTHHTYDQMKAELVAWSPLAGPQTVWWFHDTFMFGDPNTDMVRAIEEFCVANPNWKYEEVTQECHGLGKMTWVEKVQVENE